MICISEAKRMCTDYTKIKNYEKAIADKTQTWNIHHIYELKCPVRKYTMPELKAMGMYYNRPPEELVFMTASEHHKLHQTVNNSFKGKKHTEETRKIMSLHGGNAFRGRQHTEEAKEKNRLAHLGKKHNKEFGEKVTARNTGRKWYTDGTTDRFLHECPVGFWEGRSHLGKSWKLVDGVRVYEKVN